MANLKEIRNRITSVSSTKQITSAMKMVSAAKLKRAQDAITELRPYAEKLTEIMQNITAGVELQESTFTRNDEAKNILIVPVSSNRGLCGGFNSNLIKCINKFIHEELDAKNQIITVLSAGKKANDYFKKTEFNIKGNTLPRELNHLVNQQEYQQHSESAETIMNAFANKQFDRVYIVYNKFKNAATQIPTVEQLLPVELPEAVESVNTDYIFQPNKEEILEHLIPKALKIQFYKAFIDSNAAEHASRMTAMHKATDNASDLIKELKLTYNKARQAAITGEILEIVAGAEALNG